MAYNIPKDLKYTKEHEWVSVQGENATIGITDFAQSSLGDIVFVELPEIGVELDQNATFGVVESIKSVSDLYTPIAGEVIEVNDELSDAPENCNQDAYGAWIIKVKMNDQQQLSELMDAEKYEEYCQEQS